MPYIITILLATAINMIFVRATVKRACNAIAQKFDDTVSMIGVNMCLERERELQKQSTRLESEDKTE